MLALNSALESNSLALHRYISVIAMVSTIDRTSLAIWTCWLHSSRVVAAWARAESRVDTASSNSCWRRASCLRRSLFYKTQSTAEWQDQFINETFLGYNTITLYFSPKEYTQNLSLFLIYMFMYLVCFKFITFTNLLEYMYMYQI